MLKYLFDENLAPLYVNQMRRLKPELLVRAVGEPGVPEKGTQDPEILQWCKEHEFILVTDNRASMPAHLRKHLAEGRHMPGVITLRQNMSIGKTLEQLIFIAEASPTDEFQDRIAYMPVV